MLHEFVAAHRTEIIHRCRAKIAQRRALGPSGEDLEHGVPLFLDQLVSSLQLAEGPRLSAESAAKHGGDLLHKGFTIAQVVQDYGDVYQTITEMTVETAAPVTAHERTRLSVCLDEATAEAVTEYTRLREYQGTERLGRMIHEMRGLLHNAGLAFEILKSGNVGVGGSTGAVLGRSLDGLRALIDRELAEVRLGAGVLHKEAIKVRGFVEDLEVAASLDAKARELAFEVAPIAPEVMVHADREVLASIVTNLLRNAFKFTRAAGHVALRVHATGDRVRFDVEDECGGLPPGSMGELFLPFEQRGHDRSGLGLGLSICRRGARVNDGEILVRNLPGTGCVFTLELPQYHPPAPT